MSISVGSPRAVAAYKACLGLLTEWVPRMSGLLWSQGLERYLGARMDPSVGRPLTRELRSRIKEARKDLPRQRERTDPLSRLFEEWAEAELQSGKLGVSEGGGERRLSVREYRMSLGRSVKEITALTSFKHTVSELVALACLGDDKSLLELVELDKLFLTAEFTKDRVRQAVGREDRKFFRGLGRATQRDAYRENIAASKLGIACYLLWYLGFRQLGKRKLLAFVESEGLARYDDPKSFDRFLSRIGLKSRAK